MQGLTRLRGPGVLEPVGNMGWPLPVWSLRGNLCEVSRSLCHMLNRRLQAGEGTVSLYIRGVGPLGSGIPERCPTDLAVCAVPLSHL